VPVSRESGESYHLQIEAMKLAADVHRYVADPRFLEVPVELLLDKAYARERRQLIAKQLSPAMPGLPKGGTVYLAACDRELMVSSSNLTIGLWQRHSHSWH